MSQMQQPWWMSQSASGVPPVLSVDPMPPTSHTSLQTLLSCTKPDLSLQLQTRYGQNTSYPDLLYGLSRMITWQSNRCEADFCHSIASNQKCYQNSIFQLCLWFWDAYMTWLYQPCLWLQIEFTQILVNQKMCFWVLMHCSLIWLLAGYNLGNCLINVHCSYTHTQDHETFFNFSRFLQLATFIPCYSLNAHLHV